MVNTVVRRVTTVAVFTVVVATGLLLSGRLEDGLPRLLLLGRRPSDSLRSL